MKTRIILATALLFPFAAMAQKSMGPVKLAPFAATPPPVAQPDPLPLKEGPLTLEKATGHQKLLNELGITLSKQQTKELIDNKFVLIPIAQAGKIDPMEKEPPEEDPEYPQPKPTAGLAVYSDEMFNVYNWIGYDGVDVEPWRAKFITADAILHGWHKFFENAMEEVETFQLHPKLDSFLDLVLLNIWAEKRKAPAALQPHWDRLAAQIGVAKIILGDDGQEPRIEQTPGEFDEEGNPVEIELTSLDVRFAAVTKNLDPTEADRAKAELELIMEHEKMGPSPLFSLYDANQQQDFTQFTPRSHYTKNQFLRGYFRAMMYLGRQNWPLVKDDTTGLSDALLLSHAMSLPNKKGETPLQAWKEIMEITSFFAGASDDIGYPEFQKWVATQLGKKAWTPDLALDTDFLTKLRNASKELRPPGILSQIRTVIPAGESGEQVREEALQFRVFGQRFSFDAWIFTEMTPPVNDTLPATPTALYVASAFGDPAARAFARQWLAQKDLEAGMEAKIEDLATTLKNVTDDQWFASMATKQLHVIGSLAGPQGDGYPAFMQSPAWGAKKMETMLGSYAQLKHDTVLYAKQSYAEMGEGGSEEKITESSIPVGFVQPDLAFWAELSRLATYSFDGFQKHKLLPNVTEEWGHLYRFKEDVMQLRTLANKTATGQAWTRQEKLWLLNFSPSYMAEPLNPSVVPGPDHGKAALVADVQTNALEGKILYQAIGRPNIILALVGDQGKTRLVAGSAFDYYEFTQPIESRMTDEEWRKKFYRVKPEKTPKPAWLKPPAAAPAE